MGWVERLVLKFHFNRIPRQKNGVGLNIFDRRRTKNLAARHVKLGLMPRTGDRRAVQRTFGQRRSIVRTGVIHRKNSSADIKTGDPPTFDFESLGRAQRQISQGGDCMTLGHARSLSKLPRLSTL